MIKVLKKEIELGLEEAIKNNTSVAYSSQISFDDKTKYTEVDVPVDKSVASSEDWDLYPFKAILASSGWNKNDDIFDPEETFAAKDTPVFKKVNFMHDEKDIIGLITASLAIDRQQNIITDTVPDEFDIVVSAALYRRWEDPELQARMDRIIAEIPDNKWFVSMECLFRNFDYGVIDPNGSQYIIERNQSTAFLTKYLRAYGGPGVFEGKRIGRVLRNFTFSGKGIVYDPANERSIIFQSKAFKGNFKTEMNMDADVTVLKTQLEQSEASRIKAEARSEKLESELKERVDAAQKEERDRLTKELEKQAIAKEELETALSEVKSQLESATASVDKLTKENKDLVKAQEELEKEKVSLLNEKVSAGRLAELVEAGLEKEEAEGIVEAWTSASDAQFETIVALYKKNKAEDKEKMKKDDEEEKKDMSKAKVEDDPSLASASQSEPENEVEELVKAATAFYTKSETKE